MYIERIILPLLKKRKKKKKKRERERERERERIIHPVWKCTHDLFLTRNLIFAHSSSYKNVTNMKLHYTIFGMGYAYKSLKCRSTYRYSSFNYPYQNGFKIISNPESI